MLPDFFRASSVFFASSEALLSLQTATNRTLLARPSPLGAHVNLRYAVEKDKACQEVLKKTHPSVCLFMDVLAFRPDSETLPCATHGCQCQCRVQMLPGRFLAGIEEVFMLFLAGFSFCPLRLPRSFMFIPGLASGDRVKVAGPLRTPFATFCVIFEDPRAPCTRRWAAGCRKRTRSSRSTKSSTRTSRRIAIL